MSRRAAILLALAVVVGVAVYVRLSDWRSPAPTAAPLPAPVADSVASPAAGALTPENEMLEKIAAVLTKLRRSSPAAGDIAALQRQLFSNPAAGLAAIRRFLASGEDASTGQPLAIGSGGILASAPTLRLFLLDWLGQLARQVGSPVAAEVSREILGKKDSPDEWALALRNLAWAEPNSRPFLAQKMHEMLDYEPWRASPTSGMLEAFDVAVYCGDPSFVPTFARLARGDNPILQRASTVALDRLADGSTLDVMNFLNANPNEIADRPFVRADYFAKADLGDFQQRQAVEHYLSRGDVTAEEKTKFLHAVASPGSFVSDSLLSTAPKVDDGPARYAGIASTAGEWLRTGRFPELRGHVLWLVQRVTIEE